MNLPKVTWETLDEFVSTAGDNLDAIRTDLLEHNPTVGALVLSFTFTLEDGVPNPTLKAAFYAGMLYVYGLLSAQASADQVGESPVVLAESSKIGKEQYEPERSQTN